MTTDMYWPFDVEAIYRICFFDYLRALCTRFLSYRTQMMAEQLRTQNPDLAESLRSQFQQGQHPPDSSDQNSDEKKE